MVFGLFKKKKKEEPKPKAQPSQPKPSKPAYKEIVEEGLTGLKYHYNYNEEKQTVESLSPGILDAWVENPGQIKEDFLKELFEDSRFTIPNAYKEITSFKKINISNNVEPRDVDVLDPKYREPLRYLLIGYLQTFGGAHGSYGVHTTLIFKKPLNEKSKEILNRLNLSSEFLIGDHYLIGSLTGFLLSYDIMENSDISKGLDRDINLTPFRQYLEFKPLFLILDNSEYTAYHAGHYLKSGMKAHKRLPKDERKSTIFFYEAINTNPFVLVAHAHTPAAVGATFALTKDEIKKGLEEEFERGIPPEVEEEIKKNGSPTHPHEVYIDEERLIHATINLQITKNPKNRSIITEKLFDKGYELYQDVVIIMKEGTLRPIYYSMIYPVKKETAEELGSKVTLYRVKTNKETGRVINLEPIEEYHTNGTLEDLQDLRGKEIINIYEDLVQKYGKDPVRDEDIQIYVSGNLYKLCTEKAREYMEKSKQKYLDPNFAENFYNKYGKIMPGVVLDTIRQVEGKDRMTTYVYNILKALYYGSENHIEESKKRKAPIIGGPVLLKDDSTNLLVYYL